jgi:hypothetical protein
MAHQSTQVLNVFESVVVEQTKDFLFSVGKEFPDLNKIAHNIKDIPSIKKNISLIVLITYTRIYNKRPQGLELSDKGKVDELANLKILVQSVAAGAEELAGQENVGHEISAEAILTGSSRADAALHLHALVKVLDQLHRTYTRQLLGEGGSDMDGNDDDEEVGVGYDDQHVVEYGGIGVAADETSGAAVVVPSSRAARAAYNGGSAGRRGITAATTTTTTVGGYVADLMAAEQEEQRRAGVAQVGGEGGEDGEEEQEHSLGDLEAGAVYMYPSSRGAGGVGGGGKKPSPLLAPPPPPLGSGEEPTAVAGTGTGEEAGFGGGGGGVGSSGVDGRRVGGGLLGLDGMVGQLEHSATSLLEATRKQRAAKLRRQQVRGWLG